MSDDIIKELREISERIKVNGGEIHFPELCVLPEIDNPENDVYRAASTIAKHDNLDLGHKVAAKDVAALIHYIADMMATDE